MYRNRSFCILYLLLISPSLTYAESVHVQELDKLIISTPLPQSTANTALPVSILSGNELRIKAASTIGETLKNEPGISSQSFGPGVGRPVIRGQSGSRVHVLQNGLDSLDVSSLSPDHANSTEPLLAKRIEVLRGPATLLYGSGAIGGVINVLDNRIPDSLPENNLQSAVEQRYNSVNEGKSTVFKLDGGKDMFAWHLDGSYRDSINLQIPGNAFANMAEKGSHERLLNSNTHARSGSAGFSIIGEQGFVGFSVNHLDNNYGVPPGSGKDPELARIKQRQNRYDMKSELNAPFKWAEKMRVRLVYNDYQHAEIANGNVGTVFTNQGFESRIELIQKPWAIFNHGVFGAQTKNYQFSAVGEESLVPKSDVNNFGFFTLQDIHAKDFIYEIGVRIEQQWIDPQGNRNTSTSHTPISFSASALWSVNDEDSIKLTFSRSQRVPNVQELFAFGPHLATSSFAIGNNDLIEETSHNLELGIHLDHDWIQANFNMFHNWVQDYITAVDSGRFFNTASNRFLSICSGLSCLPVFNTQQRDAEFQGYEIQVTIPLLSSRYGQLESQLFSDYVRGWFTRGGDIPRMPPLRYGMQLAWNNVAWDSTIRITRAEKQNHPGVNETQTDGYWLLDSAVNYRLSLDKYADMLLFVKGNNLLDQDIRNSVSFLRDIAPQAGRGVELGVRIEF